VWTVGVDTANDAIYSKVEVEAPGPGYCHFPDAYQREYFEQLTSEEVRTRFVRGHPVRYWFKPSGVRNKALDRRVYALAALHARPVPWEVLLRAAPSEPPMPAKPMPVVTRPGVPGPEALGHKAPGRRVRYRFGKR
jgi:phage terminase large subunit GpA-like protein